MKNNSDPIKLKRRISMRKYRQNNPDYKIAECRRANVRRHRHKFNVWKHYTKGKFACNCCGEKNHFFFTVDHMDNMGAKHRREINVYGSGNFTQWLNSNKFPPGFQILCWNCQMARKFFDGVCPHKFFDKVQRFTIPSSD